MATNSTAPLPLSAGMYFYLVVSCTEYFIAFPVNLWALALIILSKRSAIETEILTLNLLLTETIFSVFFFLWLVQFLTTIMFSVGLTNFYQGSITVARTLFQWYLCIDRYLAVVHPVIFIRYRQMKYRLACLVPLWIIAIACGLNNVFFVMNPMLVSICGLTILVPTLSTEILFSLVIIRILRKSGPGEKRETEGNALKRKAVRIITFLALMAVVNNITFILFPVFDLTSYGNFFPVALALSTVGSSAHGFLYLGRVRRLQCN